MNRRRIAKSWPAWLALLAVLFASLAPTVSHAVQRGLSQGWTEVCSVGGEKWIKVDPADSSPTPPAGAHHLLEHCPYCSLHHADLGMPPAALSPAAPSSFGDFIALERGEVPAALTWNRGQPRGPPSSDV